MSSPATFSPSPAIHNQWSGILITFCIISITVLVSIFLCFLLRHLNRRFRRRHSTPTASLPSSITTTTSESRRVSSRRVSPEAVSSSVMDSLPSISFSSVRASRSTNNSSAISGDCAVCLSKFEPHDQLRYLPLCCHAFHVYCIDKWLSSNKTCPLCRSPLSNSDSDLTNAMLASSSSSSSLSAGHNNFRLEIGSFSRRQEAVTESTEQQRSFPIGSFDYVVDERFEISMTDSHRGSISDKEEVSLENEATQPELTLASDVGTVSRNWLQEYLDRLSSRALSFRSSGGFFTGSSRRNEVSVTGEQDIEANSVGEEIGGLLRWLSGV